VQLQEITPSAMQFSISCWVRDIADAGQVKSELLKKIHIRLSEAGIRYPRKKGSE
jgi:small-conductance mechanosensitive channel